MGKQYRVLFSLHLAIILFISIIAEAQPETRIINKINQHSIMDATNTCIPLRYGSLEHIYYDSPSLPNNDNDIINVQKARVQDQVSQNFQKSDIHFIENKGQIADTKGNPCPDIKYYTESINGVQMYFSADKISYMFAKIRFNSPRPAKRGEGKRIEDSRG